MNNSCVRDLGGMGGGSSWHQLRSRALGFWEEIIDWGDEMG